MCLSQAGISSLVYCLWVRPGDHHPKVEHLQGASLGYGYGPALLANIIIGWKGLRGTNTSAYREQL